MNRTLLSLSIVAGILAVPVLAGGYTGEGLASQARISLHQARSIALKAFPGTITDQELEKEGGGSGLRYSFDIRKDGVVHEVGVDAISGKVLENVPEGSHPD